MENPLTKLKIPKWPFLLAQILLLGFAYFIVWHSPHPISKWEIIACFATAAAGAIAGILPFVLDYRVMGKFIEAEALGEVAEKIQNLKVVATQISSATNEWLNVHTQAEKISNGSKEIADRMAGEIRQFSEFMQKMNDSEKATLRLEAEKLHRNEGEWLQTVVRILDHIYALHCAASRSGQPQLATQIENFQNACRGTARRMGVTPFIAAPDEPFDAERHQAVGDAKPSDGAVVAETVGTGYTFQGKLLRPAIVKLREAAAPVEESASAQITPPENENSEEQLSLQSPE
jgi:molecular chaperone GrpE (heat shock protein)